MSDAPIPEVPPNRAALARGVLGGNRITGSDDLSNYKKITLVSRIYEGATETRGANFGPIIDPIGSSEEERKEVQNAAIKKDGEMNYEEVPDLINPCVGVVKVSIEGTNDAESFIFPNDPNNEALRQKRGTITASRRETDDQSETPNTKTPPETLEVPYFTTKPSIKNRDKDGETWIIVKENGPAIEPQSPSSLAFRFPNNFRANYNPLPDSSAPEPVVEEARLVPKEARLPETPTRTDGSPDAQMLLFQCVYWLRIDREWQPVIVLFNMTDLVKLPDDAFLKAVPTDIHRKWVEENLTLATSDPPFDSFMELNHRLNDLF